MKKWTKNILVSLLVGCTVLSGFGGAAMAADTAVGSNASVVTTASGSTATVAKPGTVLQSTEQEDLIAWGIEEGKYEWILLRNKAENRYYVDAYYYDYIYYDYIPSSYNEELYAVIKKATGIDLHEYVTDVSKSSIIDDEKKTLARTITGTIQAANDGQEEITYVINPSTKTLTIEGKGKVSLKILNSVFYPYRDYLKNLVIGDGITSIVSQDIKAYVKGEPIVSTGEFVLSMVEFDFETITLGKDVQTIKGIYPLQTYYVSADNKTFSTYDGCLYSKDYAKLCAVPYQKTKINGHKNLTILGEDIYQWLHSSKGLNIVQQSTPLIIPWGVTKSEVFLSKCVLPATLNEMKVNPLDTLEYQIMPYTLSSTQKLLQDLTDNDKDYNALVKRNVNTPWYSYYGIKPNSWYTAANGKTYYFTETTGWGGKKEPLMLTGAHIIDGKAYYFQPDGSLVGDKPADAGSGTGNQGGTGSTTEKSGFVTESGKTYYYKDGKKLTGLQYINDKAYIFTSRGVMQKSGWYKSGGDWYYLNDYGAGVVKCWRLKDGKYRYLKADGKMAKNEWVVDYGNEYYVDGNGLKYTGRKVIDSKTYTFDSNGILISGSSGSTPSGPSEGPGTESGSSGFVTKNGKQYYYQNGKMLTGLQYINGKAYYFGTDGVMQRSKWVKTGGYWYYLNDYGAGVVNCWRLNGGKYFYLGADGKMKTNSWVKDYGNWYYVGSDGARYASRWADIGAARYWFGGSGKMAESQWITMADGKTYYFTDSGAMAKNKWVKNGSYWYYLGRDGAMLKNTVTPDGYRVDAQGRWR